MNKEELATVQEKLSQVLRRGSLVLAALSQLREPKYGYALIEDLTQRGVQIEQGTLYPLLRRLEDQGLLRSEWNTEGSRPRRYYVLSAAGVQVLEALTEDWLQLTQALVGLLPK